MRMKSRICVGHSCEQMTVFYLIHFIFLIREVLYTPQSYLFTPHFLSSPKKKLFAPHSIIYFPTPTLLTPPLPQNPSSPKLPQNPSSTPIVHKSQIREPQTIRNPEIQPRTRNIKFAYLFDLLCLFLHFHR